MSINVNEINREYSFEINGVSYIGNPKPNTVMYITRKVESLLVNLKEVSECLIFAETGINTDAIKGNCFVFSELPQLQYANFVLKLEKQHLDKERQKHYTQTESGYYIGENVAIGEGAYIEPGCLIGHDVIIGENATILCGSVIKNAVIGDNCYINEGAVIGDAGFTMAVDKLGNRFRIPSLGKVIIGNNVEIGANNSISRGTAGNTVIEDNVKIDALVHVGHDVYIGKNAEITAGGIVGGYAELKENIFLGINACIRNRISIGEGTTIGMGAVVTKTVEDRIVVAGNPARLLSKK